MYERLSGAVSYAGWLGSALVHYRHSCTAAGYHPEFCVQMLVRVALCVEARSVQLRPAAKPASPASGVTQWNHCDTLDDCVNDPVRQSGV